MLSRVGRCQNFPGGCPNALNYQKIRLPASEPLFVCPVCHKMLIAERGGSLLGTSLAVGLCSLLLLAGVTVFQQHRSGPHTAQVSFPVTRKAPQQTPLSSTARDQPHKSQPLVPPPSDCARSVQGVERLPFTLQFDSKKSDLDRQALVNLGMIIQKLQGKRREVLLLGFADTEGRNSKFNRDLSEQRAQAVAAELRRNGIQPAIVRGFGQECPVTPNSIKTPEALQRNRRVEVWLRR